MKLTSMKLDRKAQEQMSQPTSVLSDMPEYPWGLSVTLDNESLEALEIDDLPKVGTSYTLIAKVNVTNVSSNEGSNKKQRRSMGLQITDMTLEPPGAAKNATDMLYKGGKKG